MKKEELNTETAQQAPPIKKRLLSLDALRGITVAGMILVNNAGGGCVKMYVNMHFDALSSFL